MSNKKFRLALIVDDYKISLWQKLALDHCSPICDIVLIANSGVKSFSFINFKYLAYYIINILFIRSWLTKSVSIKSSCRTITFSKTVQGSFQKIPEEVFEAIKNENVDFIVKFGMGILHVPDDLNIPILSYHHGDPRKYRGRPAGFYETLNSEKVNGVIVQELSNKLDSGRVVAYGESKVVPWSYKKTTTNFYWASQWLLKDAILTYHDGKFPLMSSVGKLYKLPKNHVVILFLMKICKSFLERFFYGLFIEKKWKVALLDADLSILNGGKIKIDNKKILNYPSKYNFIADPFFESDGNGVYVEALDKKSGLGDIIRIDLSNEADFTTILSGKHYSFPFVIDLQGLRLILPEMADHSDPCLIELQNQSVCFEHAIKGFEGKRICDPCIFRKNGVFYLFFSFSNCPNSELHLWISSNLTGPFRPHVRSPVRLTPVGSRMGGGIFERAGELFRFGQNNDGHYGASLSVFKIVDITSTTYKEIHVGDIKIEKKMGPHTFNFDSNSAKVCLDFYEHKFSIFAGYRRMSARIFSWISK